MFTFQDFSNAARVDLPSAIATAIYQHRTSADYKIALDADKYDAQRNSTITEFVKTLYNSYGAKIADPTSSNNRLCSSFFRRLNTQRVTYSLGNGVQFADDSTKDKLGINFDTQLQNAAYNACIHKAAFMFWNLDHVHVFKYTEFAPLWDEEDGTLRAGIRFWQIDANKPTKAVLYEEDGFTVFEGESNFGSFRVSEQKRAYRLTVATTAADPEPEIIGEENYGRLPIVPLYATRLRQSTLVGMKGLIDAYDLIRSGYANDLTDCSEIYWIVGNAGGMQQEDLARFRDRLKFNHIAAVENVDDTTVTPYTQEIPYQSRKAFLDDIRAGIYEDFGGLDVHTISAGSTNDHIDAAYQPLDENADDFELQIIEAVQNLLRLLGVEDTPIFKRNRVSNEKERTEMILTAANYLDDETVLQLLPFVSPEQVESIMEKKEAENAARYAEPEPEPAEPEPIEE